MSILAEDDTVYFHLLYWRNVEFIPHFGGELRTSKEGFVNFGLITNSVLSTSTKKQRKSEGH